MNRDHFLAQMSQPHTDPWQPHAATDAHRHATRRAEWAPAMTRLTLADLDIDLQATRHLPLGVRAAAAIAVVENAARRLEQIGRGER